MKPTPSPASLSNGHAEIERLNQLVRTLQDECERLRNALEVAEAERKLFRTAFYDNLRAAREFEDVDIPSLERISAGPVEMI